MEIFTLELDNLDEFCASYKAMSNINRLKILYIIFKKDKQQRKRLSAYEIKQILHKDGITISKQGISQHLRQLVEAGLLIREKQINVGKPDVYLYKINHVALKDIHQELKGLSSVKTLTCSIADENGELIPVFHINPE